MLVTHVYSPSDICNRESVARYYSWNLDFHLRPKVSFTTLFLKSMRLRYETLYLTFSSPVWDYLHIPGWDAIDPCEGRLLC